MDGGGPRESTEIVGTALVLPAWALTAFSAQARGSVSPQAMNFTLEGKITQHTPGKLTISTEGNIIFHARYDDKTQIKRQDGSAGSPKDLRVGVKVKIEAELTEAGEVIAQKIEVQSGKSRDSGIWIQD